MYGNARVFMIDWQVLELGLMADVYPRSYS